MDGGESGLLWITEILNSGYGEQQRGEMAGEVVRLMEKEFFPNETPEFILPNWGPRISNGPAWIPPLLGFLSNNTLFHTPHPHLLGLLNSFPGFVIERSPKFIALRILAASRVRSADFGPMLLPVLHSTLPPRVPIPYSTRFPTDYLHARRLALNVFREFAPGWFSPKMENIPGKDLNKLVQAVGDPFQFPNLPKPDGEPGPSVHYDPMMVMTVLIEFASSDLWRNHLRRSNFTSFEEMVSTEDGKRTALGTVWFLPELIYTAAGIAAAIKRLEELQCLNTVEVVIMRAWAVGAVDPADHDGWHLIERSTLQFYQNHGVGRLATLKRRVTDENVPLSLQQSMRSGLDTFVELPALKLQPEESRGLTHVRLSQACQLRRLYQLFGYDPTTWEEAVAVGAGGKVGVSSGHSVALAPLMDWACDYP